MKRKLLFANIVLLAVGAVAAVHLRKEWTEARAREQAILQRRIKPVPPPPSTPRPTVPPVKAAAYSDIADKMLFSKDRNPTVVVEVPQVKPKPMPALPLFHGIVDFGDGPVAIMSEGPKAPHRDYQPGDSVGAFKLVSVDSEEIVFEWDGQTIAKKLDEIMDHSSTSAPGPAAPVATAAAQRPPQTAIPKGQPAPGADMGRGVRACQPGDTSPAGTIADGMRKVIKPSPFGSRCYWEATN